MKPEELKNRTKRFVLNAINLGKSLPIKHKPADVIEKQLLHSATSVGANYHVACRARSRVDFISKIGIVEEKIDESDYWLELLVETGIMKIKQLQDLLVEANEVTAIFLTSGKTAKSNRNFSIRNPQFAIRNSQNPKSAIQNS